jgi:hypothetical protein
MEQTPKNLPVTGSVRLLISAMSPKLENRAVMGAMGVNGSNPVTTIWVGGPGPIDVAGSYGH